MVLVLVLAVGGLALSGQWFFVCLCSSLVVPLDFVLLWMVALFSLDVVGISCCGAVFVSISFLLVFSLFVY